MRPWEWGAQFKGEVLSTLPHSHLGNKSVLCLCPTTRVHLLRVAGKNDHKSSPLPVSGPLSGYLSRVGVSLCLALMECSARDSTPIKARLALFLAPRLLQRTSLAKRHGVQSQTGPTVPAEDPDMEDQEDQQSHLTNPQVTTHD